MAQTYTRQSSIADGDTITAALFNNEYNQLLNAFSYSSSSASSTGHRHDGTAGQGGNIHTIGDLDFLNKIVADSTNNRWGVFVEVSSAAVEQIRIQDGAIVPVTDNDIDLGTSSLEFKDAYFDGTVTTDALVADTADINGGTVDGATIGANSATTIVGTTITANTAFVPDASDGAALGTNALEFSDLYLADGAVVYFGDDQDVSLTHVADTGLLLNSTMALQFNDASQYINAPSATVLDINATDEIELNATLVDINANVEVSGTLTVAGAVDFGDAALSNVGAVQLDSIAGDGDTNTSITFSGSDVITITAGGDAQFTFNNGSILPSTDNDIDLGSSSYEFKDAYFDGTVTTDALVADTADINGGSVDGATLGTNSAITQAVIDNVNINGATIGHTDDTDLITLADGVVTVAGELDATTLDISGNADIDGTLEADAITVNGTALATFVRDTVGTNMVSSNTESGITVTYDTTNDNIDFAIDAAQTTITSIYATDLIMGEDSQTAIDFGTANEIDFKVDNAARLTLTASALYPVTDNQIDLGTSSLEFKDAYFDGTVTSDAFAGPLTGDVTGTSSKVTVSDSTANTNFPVVFHDESDSLLDDTGALRYNPSTGQLLVPNLTVAGTTTTVDTVTMEASNAIIFEGATADAHETTLTVIDPTGDRTINLPNVSGTLPVLAATSTTQISSTPEELNILDGATVVVGEINALDLGSTAVGTAIASKAVILDSNKDYTGIRNLTITGELDGATLDISGDADIDGTLETDALTINGSALNYKAFGTSSIMLGDNATGTIDAANFNTGVGVDVFAALTSGDGNTAVGYQALDANTTGAENVAVGKAALSANTTANSNVAVGVESLQDNTTGASNTGVGTGSLKENTTASNNTAFGYHALRENTTGDTNVAVGKDSLLLNSTGTNNTAVGARSLDANTTGASNVAVGDMALGANTTASNNTGIGTNALAANTTGGNNQGFGMYALAENTTGGNNTSVGYNALGANTTASDNTAVGFRALEANTTGTNNTALGKGAGIDITTGDDNTAIGQEALFTATTASDNTAVGFQALYSNTSGENNCTVGHNAGFNITTGGSNVCIGKSAGDNKTTGSNNIIIGTDSDGLDADETGEIIIGHGLQGVGANYITIGTGTGNDRVYNQFTSNASWTRVSDERYKKEIQDNTDCGLDFINDLRPVTFKWKEKSELDPSFPDYDPEDTNNAHTNKLYGLIAQEVKEALDKNNITDFGGWNSVTTGDHTQQGISQEMFIHPLIKAVQELSAKVEELKKKLSEEK